jgi:hypothetical protein
LPAAPPWAILDVEAMMAQGTIEKLQRVVYREFLLERGLAAEVGLEQLPTKLAALLGCRAQDAVSQLTSSPLLGALALDPLRELLQIRDMSVVSRTAAALSAELKDAAVGYEACCRAALCYSVIGSHSHVFSALRAAANKHDEWARHHYLYGLILGIGGNAERARWELRMALRYEPYDEGRSRIQMVIDTLDGAP